MVLGIGVVLYLVLALFVARFLSMSSRWERVIGGLMEADMSRLAVAGAAEHALSAALPAMTPAPLPAKPVPAAPIAAQHEEEPVLVEVGF